MNFNKLRVSAYQIGLTESDFWWINPFDFLEMIEEYNKIQGG